jgi:flagellar M-ring protein FliF
LDALRNFIGQIGTRRALLMGGVAAALLLGLGWMAMRTPQSAMGYLYTDLDPSAAATITDKLKGQGVPFQLSADGSAIMAPVDKLPELRMAMASEQLGGKIGYEVLDEEEPFGISSSRAKLNETRAIEGELVRSIESLDRVARARVHVVMPERAMFETEPRKASASVTVKTNGRLPPEAVQAIRYLVASAVPDLSPEAVSVVDQTGALLARAGEGEGAAGNLEDRQAAVEARLRDQIETMVEPLVGRGKVRAEVSAVLERDQVREESEVFDPDTQVIQHQVTVESSNQSNENEPGAQGATVATQLPDNQTPPGAAPGDSRRSAQTETSEDVTYQNSRTQKVAVRTPGQVKRLTVAVMVDGGEKGLAPPQLERLKRLVENAVGYDAERGDSVVVENMPFAAPGDLDGIDGGLPFGLTVDRILDVLKILLVGGIVLFAIRMLRGSGVPRLPAPVAASEEGEGEAGGERRGRELTGSVSYAQLEPEPEPEALLDQEVALAHVDGRVKLSALRRIGDTISANPAESASVIRQWMNT